MNTQELKCFLRVAERMNFARAAQELYLTPPTVTHHIQKLESELGVRLFQRNSKSVSLTLEGEAFYQDAREIMLKIESAFIHLNDIKNSKHTLLTIGCLTSEEAITQGSKKAHGSNMGSFVAGRVKIHILRNFLKL